VATWSDVAERVALEDALRRARDAADAANRAKGAFLATMSHELRTPLNAISGHVQLLEMGLHGAVTDAQQDALGRVQRAQRHLLRLINDILNFARLEAGAVAFAVERSPWPA
jgi:signal transduction histidine kinase